MPVLSMTGFARVKKTFDEGEIIATVRSVNHRGLDLHFRLSPELDSVETALRAAVKRKMQRGHVQIQLRVIPTEELAPSVLNRSLLEAYLTAFRRAAAIHGLHGEPDLNSALRMPGMFDSVEPDPDPCLEQHSVAALDEALDLLNEFRMREGAQIAIDMRDRSATIQECVRAMEEMRSVALPNFHQRLSERLAELLDGASLEPQRLAQEVALMADRSDISEELTRLKIHSVQLNEILDRGGEIGKKLDFMLQEMQREANTILSKSSGIGELGLSITDSALRVKAEIEKIREQSLNLE